MKHALVFSLMITPSCSLYLEAEDCIDSLLKRLRMDMFEKRFFAYDPMFTDKDSVSHMLGAFEPLEVPPMTRSLQQCGCRQLDFVSAVLEKGDFDTVTSVPSNWYLTSKLDISGALMAAASPDVFSVFLGGCPLAHVDGGGYFSLGDSTLPKYRRLRTSTWNLTGLDRGECPSIFNAANFPEIFKANQCNLNFLNRCGWDPKLQVLYPDALKSSPGDIKPEPFRDIVGICPEYWDRYDKYELEHETERN